MIATCIVTKQVAYDSKSHCCCFFFFFDTKYKLSHDDHRAPHYCHKQTCPSWMTTCSKPFLFSPNISLYLPSVLFPLPGMMGKNDNFLKCLVIIMAKMASNGILLISSIKVCFWFLCCCSLPITDQILF